MASSNSLCLLLLVSFTCLIFTSMSSLQTPKHYVVYMGSLSSDEESNHTNTQSAYLQLLASVIPREEKERLEAVHHYKHAFKGFSAMLTDDEASFFSRHDEVISVFVDPILQLHTTRSWDFLESISRPIPMSHISNDMHGSSSSSSDVIVGLIDTGIWAESASFKDEGMEEIPSKWRGTCMEGPNFKRSNCNRKLIGARYYTVTPTRHSQVANSSEVSTSSSPRDSVGHGTHTASIAAGARVLHASYHGLAPGTAKGGDPSSRIAVYKACTEDGCSGAAILKAIDDAVDDGVDLISISIGQSSALQADYLIDPIAIGAFHAELKGILVICSGGNEGPMPFTVVNTAPWIFTVAASDIDRKFQSSVVLGNGKVFQGLGINMSNLTRSETYPLVYGKDAAAPFVPVIEAKSCYPGSLDGKKVMGKIIVCMGNGMSLSTRIQKLVVEDAGGKGMILIDEEKTSVPFDSEDFPFSAVGDAQGFKILKYMAQTKNPTATILSTVEVEKSKPAPVVAYFSSRGPGVLSENILKPDVMAPGVAILGAMIPNETEERKETKTFGLRSGTSMACPHVTGAAAFLKSLHPSWSPSMIKSALMTTATLYDNKRQPISNTSSMSSTPHEMGTGEISPARASDPGLVFETTPQDYLSFLCFYGYSQRIVRSFTKTNFTCPNKTSTDSISSAVNYPSISIGNLRRSKSYGTAVHRTVTNVGSVANATYVARIEAPEGLEVRVFPKKLVFGETVRKHGFRVWFRGNEDAGEGYHNGFIVWYDGHHSVSLVFSIRVQ